MRGINFWTSISIMVNQYSSWLCVECIVVVITVVCVVILRKQREKEACLYKVVIQMWETAVEMYKEFKQTFVSIIWAICKYDTCSDAVKVANSFAIFFYSSSLHFIWNGVFTKLNKNFIFVFLLILFSSCYFSFTSLPYILNKTDFHDAFNSNNKRSAM